ncbi:Bug family tripartite tricarboxylate transporter substrate binding protein [Dankookia sp. P2]|uniref:Bug family tripartite tricarboxylate transporter substrate binding protein n=1 Tax=Dankookia sp. P2 TaxID=3423955 RepID=UPI003D66B8C4
MTNLTRRATLGLALAAGGAAAQAPPAWPDRPIRILAPYPPGGQTDLVSRWLAEQLRPAFPQPVLVENRAGAQGIIGTQAALAAPADGTTLLYVNASTTLINPVIHANPGYDTFRDMQPLVQFGTAALVLAVRPDRGIATLADLLAEARRRPAQLSYASFGIGSASHLYGAMLETVAEVRMVHVPYRGSAPAVLDVVAGNAFLSINDEAVTVPQVREGRLLPLAVTGPARIDTLPEVPSFVELGYRGGLECAWLQRAGAAGRHAADAGGAPGRGDPAGAADAGGPGQDPRAGPGADRARAGGVHRADAGGCAGLGGGGAGERGAGGVARRACYSAAKPPEETRCCAAATFSPPPPCSPRRPWPRAAGPSARSPWSSPSPRAARPMSRPGWWRRR